jgi:hypothetical protein
MRSQEITNAAFAKAYTDLLRLQRGGGFGTVFKGPYYQTGQGFGTFFSALFRAALPLLKSGAKAVGRQAVRSGSNILEDVLDGQNVKMAAKRGFTQGMVQLGETASKKLKCMEGAGRIKAVYAPQRLFSQSPPGIAHTPPKQTRKKQPVKKKKPVVRKDIFL